MSIEQIKTMPEMVIPGVEGTLVDVKEYKRDVGPKKTTVQSFKIQQGNHWILGDAWGMADLTPWRGQHVIFVSNKAGNNKLAGVSIKEKPSMDGSKTYKNLSISSTATMHDRDTYEASKGAAPTTAPVPQAPAQQAPAPSAPFVPKPPVQQGYPNPPLPTQSTAHHNQSIPPQALYQPGVHSGKPLGHSIQGVTVGMAINNSVQIYLSLPEQQRHDINAEQFLWEKASAIIRVAQRLERGDLFYYQNIPDNPGYTKADTAAIESFENALPAKRPTPGHGGTAFNVNSQDEDPDNIPF